MKGLTWLVVSDRIQLLAQHAQPLPERSCSLPQRGECSQRAPLPQPPFVLSRAPEQECEVAVRGPEAAAGNALLQKQVVRVLVVELSAEGERPTEREWVHVVVVTETKPVVVA